MIPERPRMERSCPSPTELPATDVPDGPLTAARRAEAAGLSVVPPREDGSKAPEGYWSEFQSRRARPDELA
jgi:hypothetical protein